ncbi:MAG TPA: hypothetical protein VJ912_00945 [Candidatus Nanoarchaeia archaeon]|nr:hypothetical protein [Candidatus Nanoarchaeia archaeon]
MAKLMGSFEEETNKKKSNLEAIAKAFLGRDFETYSIKDFPYIFSIYEKKIIPNSEQKDKSDPIAFIHINKNLIHLKHKKYLKEISQLKEAYIKNTKQEWEIEEKY